MKLKSLLMGSVAAAGLSSGAFAADPAVLTSLNVCDLLGLSGLTVSSDTNCLQISGGVEYEFNWGDYTGATTIFGTTIGHETGGTGVTMATSDGAYDWNSSIVAWLKFVGTADSDFGPAKAVIKLKNETDYGATNTTSATVTSASATTTGGAFVPNAVVIDEAYVAIGDSTILMAGKKGSVANFGDDTPFNFLGLFISSDNDAGVEDSYGFSTGGHVIQVTSDLGNGVSLKGGLEDLNGAGTAVGVLEYAGDNFSGHVTVLAGGILDGVATGWAIHAGGTATMDMFKLRGAVAADDTGWWNILGSAEATFDMFTLAGSVEADHNPVTGLDQLGFGASAGAEVATGIKINAGFRWLDPDTATADDEGWQAAAQLVAAVTETVTVTGEVGVYGAGTASGGALAGTTAFYGKGELAWAPGGGFTSSVGGEMNSLGAYKVTFKAAKSFE
jgi:hypothetical protein